MRKSGTWSQIGRPLLLSGLSLWAVAGYTNPQGGTVVSGSSTIHNVSPTKTVIDQTSNTSIINWQSFSIGSGQTTQFIQPSSSSLSVDRVTGGNVSQIFGMLTANGQIILINPAGIWFGPGSVVDVAGLIATTNNITNQNVNSRNFQFDALGANAYHGAVINDGTITVKDTGLAALMAPAVANNGIITANLGQVVLASGNAYTLDFYGDKLINFAVVGANTQVGHNQNGKAMKNAISNKGTIIADGGQVTLTAQSASKIVENSINVSGIIQANSVGVKNGRIYLFGGNNGTVKVTGQLTASGTQPGTKGGTIGIYGKKIKLAKNAKINASGRNGGGTIQVGGGAHGSGPNPTAATTSIGKNVVLNADAIDQGNGGTIVVWSNDHTDMSGTATARGGATSGNGGFIETSSKNTLDASSAHVDASAPNGKAGTWLLDPIDVVIDAPFATTIESSLSGGTSVTIDATVAGAGTGTITQNADIIVPTTVGTPTLEYLSANTIALNAAVSGPFNFVIMNGGNVNLNSGSSINVNNFTVTPTGSGFTFNVNTPSTITTTGNQTYNLDVNLLANASFNTPGTVSFNNNIIGGGNNLTVNQGSVNFGSTGGETMTGINNLIANNANLYDPAVTTTGTQTYNGLLTFLVNNKVLTGTTVTIQALQTNSNDMTINGNTVLGLTNADEELVNNVTINGPITFNTYYVAGTASGVQTYNGPVTIGSGVTLNGGQINILNSVTSSTNGYLVFQGTGPDTLGASSANTVTGISKFITGTPLIINASLVSTTTGPGDIDILAPLTLGGNVTLTAGSPGTVTLGGDVTGNNHNLIINGNTVLDNVAYNNLNSLQTTGPTSLNATTLSANTSLALGALTLAGGDTVFTAPTISTGTINGGGFSLALNGASSVGATVADSVTNLTSLNLNGNSNVYAGNLSLPTITGSGTVTFINPVTLSENLAVSGTSLAFQGNITGPAYTLTLTGPTTLGSTGAEVVNLATLTANSPLTLDLASITTSGNQLYNVPVNLMSNVTLNPSGNTVTFGANVNANNNNLTIDGAATLGNVTYSNLNTLDITGPTQLNVASLTASTDISLGATTLGGGNTVLTAPTIGVGSVNGGGSSSLTLNGASTVGSSGADSVTGLTSLALNGNSNVLAGTLSLPTITGAGSMNFQNPVNLLAPIVIDTSNQNVTFFSPISGGQNMTFALGTGNLAFNGEGISTIGNVLVNSVGNLSVVNSGTLDVTGFTQSAGTGFSNFGNTLDAGPNNVNVTTNGTISGTVIGNILNFHSNDGSVDVNATANSMMIFAATGSNTTGCVNGVCAVEGNPTMVPALTIEPGSGGTNFFNGLELGVFTPSVTPNPFGTDALYFELFARDYNTQSIDLEYYKTNPSDSDDEDTYQRNFQGLFADADSDGSCQASGGQAQGSS